MNPEFRFLSAGAAQGLVRSLQPTFEHAHGVAMAGRFGAVGAMKEALLAGEPCDLFIVTDAMVDALAADGLLRAGTKRAIGRVRTGIAVRRGEPRPDVSSRDALHAALRDAEAVYLPDPVRATAGIHFVGVLKALGLHDALASRLHAFPNGATAMRELAASAGPRRIGCTQVSEIVAADGVDLVGPLPPAFELSTVYSAAVAARAARPDLAAAFIDAMTGADAAPRRRDAGFE